MPATPKSGSARSTPTTPALCLPAHGSCGRTEAGPQAYTLGPHLLVQFHPEATPGMVEAWLAYDDTDFHRAGVDPNEMLRMMRAGERAARGRAEALVERFLGGIEAT